MDMIIVLAAILALAAITFSLAALGMVIESVQQTRLMTRRLAEQLRRLEDFEPRPLEPHSGTGENWKGNVTQLPKDRA